MRAVRVAVLTLAAFTLCGIARDLLDGPSWSPTDILLLLALFGWGASFVTDSGARWPWERRRG